MRNIMTFELYKSTYMSAADELEKDHKQRAEELRKHAAEKGISAFRGKEGFDMIHPHAFVFSNYKPLTHREDLFGKFFITDFEDKVYSNNYRQGYEGVIVIMKSDYGNTVKMELVVGPNEFLKLDLEYGFERGQSMRAEYQNFKFNNRKDAIEFRKFIFDLCKDGEITDGEEYFNLETLPINKLYKTE